MAGIRCKTMSMEERKQVVSRLVEQFRENEQFYMRRDFVESECRSKFIDPFLECLAWDVKNEKGARHDKAEVITEDRVVVEGQVKHPDYTLCYGGIRKIYVEAKQPSVNLKTNPEPALQVRRYAYSSKMPIAILTDFQEFAVYDTRIKPKPDDSAAVARIEYMTYQQYCDKFEELYSRISWEAVDLGKFDTYWETSRDKKGTAAVDSDILSMIERWRILLAEEIARRNGEIDEFNLTSAVQKIIDRILFLRICEDKEIEERGKLRDIVFHCAFRKVIYKTKPLLGRVPAPNNLLYPLLKTLFSDANKKFNAGLFASDKWLDSLEIDDRTLSSIISELYFPKCQYEFSVIPIEILGSIYERFLGKTISFTRKTKNGHSIEIIEKPEVQKAGGVYYTPPYIVNYIAAQTIGRKIEGKTPEKVAKMRFLDPACGSGSFLVGAYQYLLDWHLNYYLDPKNAEKAEKKGKIYKDADTKEYKLSIEEKRSILLNNIFGVDIDAQAVEVTKLSLFLKLLENEGKSLSPDGQMNMFRASELKAKILPNLGGNIKCGNSLIGSDFYIQKDLSEFGLTEQRRVNAFDWEKEFPFAGFDCVIGNPPYGAAFSKEEELYLRKKYPHQSYQLDSYLIFTEKVSRLVNKNGLIGFIMPNTWLSTVFSEGMRRYIFDNYCVKNIRHYSFFVFKEATVETDIYIWENSSAAPAENDIELAIIDSRKKTQEIRIPQKLIMEKNGSPINIYEYADRTGLKEKLSGLSRLSSFVQIVQGAKPFQKGKGNPPQTEKTLEEKPFIQEFKKDRTFVPCLRGNLINRYANFWDNNYFISYGDWLAEPRYSAKFDCPEKLLVRQTGDSIIAAYDDRQFVARDNLYVVRADEKKINLKYLLCLLNSSFVTWYYRTYINPEKGKVLAQVKRTHLLQIPVPAATADQQAHLAKLADAMIAAKRCFADAQHDNCHSDGAKRPKNLSDSDKKLLAQRVQLLDSQINAAVYKLYSLTEQEIKTVEVE
ncbi:N-6 DNA methylase [bacterium]|nr:N-6 DNA methylase [bacterium]